MNAEFINRVMSANPGTISIKNCKSHMLVTIRPQSLMEDIFDGSRYYKFSLHEYKEVQKIPGFAAKIVRHTRPRKRISR
jgi:hypothetical protein